MPSLFHESSVQIGAVFPDSQALTISLCFPYRVGVVFLTADRWTCGERAVLTLDSRVKKNKSKMAHGDLSRECGWKSERQHLQTVKVNNARNIGSVSTRCRPLPSFIL